MYRFILLVLLIPIETASYAGPAIKTGIYRATLTLREGAELPFNFEIKEVSKNISLDFINGEERIHADEVSCFGDSIIIKMPVFDTEIRAKITSNEWQGYWINHNRKVNNILPFKAIHGLSYRFADKAEKPAKDLSGKWETDFSPGTADSSKGLGVFKQSANNLSGTFLSTTGDYRYLDGTVQGNKLMLSCFDGGHAYLFTADIGQDGTLHGIFYSGSAHKEPWQARLNPHYELPDANALTFLKPGFDNIQFSFPDLDSHIVSLNDPRYAGKITIVQIMGSWCPNCMDESSFLSGFYKKHRSEGVEIIGLAYERTPVFREAKRKVERVKKRFGMDYTLCIAGMSGTADVEKSLPMLAHVISFPTMIIIDKKGKVRRIHTGYSGPATGKYYDDFKEEFTAFIEKLEREK